MVERLIVNQKVTGSSPVKIANSSVERNRLIEVMVTCPTVSRAPRVRFSYKPQNRRVGQLLVRCV